MSERLQIRNPDETGCTRSQDHGYELQATNSRRLVGSSEPLLESGWSEKSGDVLLDARQHHERASG